MLYENIDKLIAEAMKNHDNVRLSTLRLIKTKFLEYKTSKGAKPIDETIEISILRKMVSERTDSLGIYLSAGRNELAEKEQNEINIIKEFLPAEITEEQISQAFNSVLSKGIEPVKKNMGVFIKEIKNILPTADGKTVSTYVQKHLS
jgi:uncharacterized protein YqeY